jgi:3-hydroxyisobutyrate dehydrogenase
MPVAAVAGEIVRAMHGSGYVDQDFAALLEIEARASGLELEPEDVPVSDGLEARMDGAPVRA